MAAHHLRDRGRKSRTSADYSFEAGVRDINAVLGARGAARAVIVGWSYGAFPGAHWAARSPDRTIGAVLVDGAMPHDWLDDAMEERIRTMFQRMAWFMPLLRPTGPVPRLNAEEQAAGNIELGKMSRKSALGPVMDAIAVPTRFVLASGTSLGSKGDEQEVIRASLDQGVACNPHIRISAKVPGTTATSRARTTRQSPRPSGRWPRLKPGHPWIGNRPDHPRKGGRAPMWAPYRSISYSARRPGGGWPTSRRSDR
ncbi:alpha/beta fold hydrolase [Actinoplanes sp. CA-252034]|uniref:alpha/beta fold hydrolase n=1 Tax=Actinoplanes sp. CA-252034 TaxID=3239906 RepID=UPI003D96A8B2